MTIATPSVILSLSIFSPGFPSWFCCQSGTRIILIPLQKISKAHIFSSRKRQWHTGARYTTPAIWQSFISMICSHWQKFPIVEYIRGDIEDESMNTKPNRRVAFKSPQFSSWKLVHMFRWWTKKFVKNKLIVRGWLKPIFQLASAAATRWNFIITAGRGSFD